MLTLLTISLLSTTGILWYMDGYTIIKNVISKKYNRFKTLQELVSTQYKNIFIITYVSICLILQALYITMCQKLNNSVKKIDRRTYEITYIINGQLYKINVCPKIGPSYILLITDENEQDMTDIVLPYLGPQLDCHGNKKYTPLFFQRSKLTFELSDGNSIDFNLDTSIKLKMK
jgi:hypothetical protein